MSPDSTAGRSSGSTAPYLPKWNFFPLLIAPASGRAAAIFNQLMQDWLPLSSKGISGADAYF